MQIPYVHNQDNNCSYFLLNIFSIFIENRFSHTIHPDHSFSFLYLFQLPSHLPSLPDPCQMLFCFRKGQALTSKQDKTKCNNLRPMSVYQGCTEQPQRRNKFSQMQAKDSKIYILPLIRIPPKHQDNSRIIDVEHLVQIHTGPMLAASVSVSPCDA